MRKTVYVASVHSFCFPFVFVFLNSLSFFSFVGGGKEAINARAWLCFHSQEVVKNNVSL